MMEFVKLDPTVPTPQYATKGSAGIDLSAHNITILDHVHHTWDKIVIKPGEVFKVGTGLSVYIRDDCYMGMVVPRSGGNGLTLANTVGIIDSDYQGEIILKLTNTSQFPVMIRKGQRVAQMVITRIFQPNLEEVIAFEEFTERGEGGFGSTGK